MFIGLVDGDGYIAITRTIKGYISLELVISLHERDIELLEYLKSVLNIGRIKAYPNFRTVKYIIGKVDLQEILIPLLQHYNLFFFLFVVWPFLLLCDHYWSHDKRIFFVF